jgi:hypothetical protein
MAGSSSTTFLTRILDTRGRWVGEGGGGGWWLEPTRLVLGVLCTQIIVSDLKTEYSLLLIDYLPDMDCRYKLSGAILHISGHEICGVPISADWSAATRTMAGMMVTGIMGIYEMDRDVQICWVCRLSRSFLGSLLA